MTHCRKGGLEDGCREKSFRITKNSNNYSNFFYLPFSIVFKTWKIQNQNSSFPDWTGTLWPVPQFCQQNLIATKIATCPHRQGHMMLLLSLESHWAGTSVHVLLCVHVFRLISFHSLPVLSSNKYNKLAQALSELAGVSDKRLIPGIPDKPVLQAVVFSKTS